MRCIIFGPHMSLHFSLHFSLHSVFRLSRWSTFRRAGRCLDFCTDLCLRMRIHGLFDALVSTISFENQLAIDDFTRSFGNIGLHLLVSFLLGNLLRMEIEIGRLTFLSVHRFCFRLFFTHVILDLFFFLDPYLFAE